MEVTLQSFFWKTKDSWLQSMRCQGSRTEAETTRSQDEKLSPSAKEPLP